MRKGGTYLKVYICVRLQIQSMPSAAQHLERFILCGHCTSPTNADSVVRAPPSHGHLPFEFTPCIHMAQQSHPLTYSLLPTKQLAPKNAVPIVTGIMWEALETQRPSAWRVVFKGLTLLEHLIKNGSERCVDDARNHSHTLRALHRFNYYEGTIDRGVGVREKSKQLVEILGDDERIREERQKARKMREKFGTTSGGSMASVSGGGGGGGGASSRYAGYGNDDSQWRSGGGGGGYGDSGIGSRSGGGGYGDDGGGSKYGGRYADGGVDSASSGGAAAPTFASLPPEGGERIKKKKKKKKKAKAEAEAGAEDAAAEAAPAPGEFAMDGHQKLPVHMTEHSLTSRQYVFMHIFLTSLFHHSDHCTLYDQLLPRWISLTLALLILHRLLLPLRLTIVSMHSKRPGRRLMRLEVLIRSRLHLPLLLQRLRRLPPKLSMHSEMVRPSLSRAMSMQ